MASTSDDPNAAAALVDLEAPDLDIVREIDKFLEEYNSDDAENTENSNFPDELVDDLLKNVDMADLENTFLEEISHETFSIDEIKEIDHFSFSYCYNQGDFSATENAHEKYSNNSTTLDEINTKNDTDNNLAIFQKQIDNIQDTINAPQNNDDQKFENQDNTSNSQSPRIKQTKNNVHTNCKSKLLNKNLNSKKKQRFNKKITQNRNNDKPLLYETKKKCSSINDYSLPKSAFTQQKNTELQFSKPKRRQTRKNMQGINQSDTNKSLVKNNNAFQKSNIKNRGPAFNDFHHHPYLASTSTIQSSVYNNNAPMNPYDFKRQNKNKLPLNLPHYESEEHLNFPRYENIQHFEKHTNSPILPVQQDLCHVQNLQYPQKCVQNEVISKPSKNPLSINKSKILLHYVIKDHLLPVSLDGTTVQFSSKKLINTRTRCDIEVALKKHGTLENTWWTPDDMFFATYTLREMAQFVYEMYLKY